jgi:hypothetical protein
MKAGNCSARPPAEADAQRAAKTNPANRNPTFAADTAPPEYYFMKMTDGKFKTPIYLATPENYKALIEFNQYPDIARIAPHCQVHPSPNHLR